VNERSILVVVLDPDCDEPAIFIPNAFTPNGDGENDVFFVRGNGIDEMQLVIYNRWGEKVFESNSKDNGWDGRFNGELLSTDVFGFSLEVRCTNGALFKKQGNVTLLK
jgi:gliding motility-associated-like protein